MKKSVSVVIPAYNEDKTIEATVNKVDKIVKSLFYDYELLVFDDGSIDKTGRILDKLAKKSPKMRIFHNMQNMNAGYNFRMGISKARKEYVVLLPGGDSVTISSIKNFMKKIGDGNIVIAYVGNPKTRRVYRRIISYIVTKALNLLFGLNVKYFFGIAAYKTELVRKVKATSNSFALLTEILVRMIRRGYSYVEVPMYGHKGGDSSTSAFRIRNIAGVIVTVLRLLSETYSMNAAKITHSK